MRPKDARRSAVDRAPRIHQVTAEKIAPERRRRKKHIRSPRAKKRSQRYSDGYLSLRHVELLERSAISPKVARARGYRTIVTKVELRDFGFGKKQRRVPALLVPIYGVRGEIVLYQLRPDDPRQLDGRSIKYETPRGSHMVLDVPPMSRAKLNDPNEPLFFTEGSKKADAAVSKGLCCVALLGVWCWRGTNELGGKVALPDWESIALNGRDVVIVFDSDVTTKPSVQDALLRLKAFLASRGAHVRVIALPGGPNGEKVGLDDFLYAHTADELLALPDHQLQGFFDEKGHFVPARLGAYLIDESTIRVGHDRRLWRYFNGVYRPDGDDWAKCRTRELVGDRFRRNHLEEVAAWLRAQLPSIGHNPPHKYLNCVSGLLDWKSGTLVPHSPEILSTNQIPVAWNPAATAPVFDRFLREVLPKDAIDLVEEVIGYALYPGNPFRKAVMLLGAGGNGKSVLLRLITALVGAENVSAVPLQALGEDRFAAADVFGKLANVCGDLDARAIQRTDLFKQITGGDSIRAQFKFRDGFSFVSYALALFSANEPPRSADQTNAWFDRWVIVPMEMRFEGTEKEDTALSDKLAAELEGVLVRAVAGLQRLMIRGHFAFPPSVVRARERYREMLDTVRGFVVEECRLEADAWVDRAHLYMRYKHWCREGGRLFLASSTFNMHLVQAYRPTIVARKRRGRPGWLGLALGAAPSEGDRGDEGDEFPTLSNRARELEREQKRERVGRDPKGVPLVPPVPSILDPAGLTRTNTNGTDPIGQKIAQTLANIAERRRRRAERKAQRATRSGR